MGFFISAGGRDSHSRKPLVRNAPRGRPWPFYLEATMTIQQLFTVTDIEPLIRIGKWIAVTYLIAQALALVLGVSAVIYFLRKK